MARTSRGMQQASISEFFEKNKHFLGFDTLPRSIITAVKESVDNSLDAAEEHRILPEISIEIRKIRGKKNELLLISRDNGPGIPQKSISKVFGSLLFGSRFHSLRQTRGQQGIGITGVVMYSQLTTGKPTTIISKIAKEAGAVRVNVGLDTKKNRAITSGEKICALAITEPDAGSDMAAYSTKAVRDGNHWVISGAKTFITNGVNGDLYFVAAKTRDDGPRHQRLSQFLVERTTPGLSVSKKLKKTGMWASDTAELAFDSMRVPEENLLGTEGKGFHQLAEGLQRERIMAAVLSVSASTQALEDCQKYLGERTAFGGPLSDFQALRHRMADMATNIEAARRLTYHAASLYATSRECTSEVSMAKLFATETANRIAYDAVQLHGGYGYIRETRVERFARDYRLWTIAAGTSEIMREIIAKRLLPS